MRLLTPDRFILSRRACEGRGYRAARCEVCALRSELCLCGSLPREVSGTTVDIVTHYRDWTRPSNTARLAGLVLTNARVFIRGEPPALSRAVQDAGAAQAPGAGTYACTSEEALTLEPDTWLLYPSPQARSVRELVAQGRAPSRLLVPDGTWPQTRRWVARAAGLQTATAVFLVPRERQDRLRRAPAPGQLSTFEAIAAALAELGEGALAARLETVFAAWQLRQLQSRNGGLSLL